MVGEAGENAVAPGAGARLDGRMDQPLLRDDRVLLRAPGPADVDACTQAGQDPENARWLTSLPQPYRREHAAEFLLTAVPAGWLADSSWTWAVADPQTGELLGMTGLHDVRRDEGRAEVGYWVAPWARGRGVATAALRLATRWALGPAGLARVEWLAVVGNEASWAVARHAGFRFEGTLRGRLLRRHDQTRHDAWVGGLLATDLP